MSANSLLSQTPLTPGFMVVHANRLEDLRGLAVEWMRLHPLSPLENETILVQSNGIGQWLKLALAEDPAQRRQHGVARAGARRVRRRAARVDQRDELDRRHQHA